MKRYKIAILKNEHPQDYKLWIDSCKKRSDEVEYSVIDLSQNDWFEKISSLKFDAFLAKPPGLTNSFKQLYDEKIAIINDLFPYKLYPTVSEINIYENKRRLSFWLKANNIPHPKTDVFYSKEEAINFIKVCSFPFVAKLNIGASGKGVTIIKDATEGMKYIEEIFTTGRSPKTGPNLKKGKLFKRLIKKLLNPSQLQERLFTYRSIKNDIQVGYVIVQEYIPHNFEWRVVKIGDSYFAHKKITVDGKASGSLKKGYDNPPIDILSFVKDITDKHNFFSQAVDIFQTGNNEYLVNEMQCIFGQSDEHQMYVDGEPGRYYFNNNMWFFEKGSFCTNQCFDLRLEYVINKLKQNNENPFC